ncbi:lymphocyte expansion molecule [Lingula anatina]|uniref:Lymphocyte expansion molecule n=1 Tax=Lingula anatina TaxID=7574 RepID=A0A1S3JSZ9_LINAN|nr:lymphocyte expansion molecule [Lingula anatina]|eukprot:XP_013413164.1 lymphocyte expansion molecule [Lingula anatina]
MAEKKYKGAPFGTQTARFDVSAVHPKNKMPGTFTQTPYCRVSMESLNRTRGPGKYAVEVGGFSPKSVEERASGPGWARQYEVQRMAAMPHLLHKEQWELKRLLKRKLAPGTYNIKDFLETSDERPRSIYGICATKEPRFRNTVTNATPGPGTYGIGGVPHAALEQKEMASTSTVGMLDAVSSMPRSLPLVGSDLGPGSYNFESFTKQLERKVTSLRGPYDLFSGQRNKPITTGHLAVPTWHTLGPGQYDLKSFVDDWGTIHKKKHGKMGKVQQHPDKPSERILVSTLSQCPKEMGAPGPGAYNAKEISKPQAHNSPGFLSSARRDDRMAQKFFTRNFNPVGAGRYDVQKWEEAQHVNGHESVFKSKSGKISLKREQFLKERLRAKDVPFKERVFIIPPEKPDDYMTKTDMHMQFSKKKAVTVA